MTDEDPQRRHDDAWTLVLERHVGRPPPGDPPSGGGVRVPRAWLVAAGVAGVLLVAAVGVLAALAVVNHGRADENLDRATAWRDRSEELQRLVGERTRDLNRQTARLNVASNRLRSARASIRRSEQDVAALEVRQRELAAEKAAVEDERAQLEIQQDLLLDAAVQIGECNAALIDLYNAGGADGVLADLASAECSEAEGAVAGLSGVAP